VGFNAPLEFPTGFIQLADCLTLDVSSVKNSCIHGLITPFTAPTKYTVFIPPEIYLAIVKEIEPGSPPEEIKRPQFMQDSDDIMTEMKKKFPKISYQWIQWKMRGQGKSVLERI
jgi:hypothetical protein